MTPSSAASHAVLAFALVLAASRPQGEGAAPTEPAFHLPYPAGKSYVCIKTGGTEDEKSGPGAREALDFALPAGSVVCAAADGHVVEVRENSELTGETDVYEAHANKVVIDHGDGRYTRYLHLAHDSVVVEEGELVRAGQKLAQSGATGRTTMPKLRFALTDVWGQAVPVRFAELKTAPVEKKPCLSKNEDTSKVVAEKKPASRFGSSDKEKPAEEPRAAPPLSNLPPDAFAFNGVELTSALPANVFEHDWTYVITGRVTDGSERVTLFLCKRDPAQSGTVAYFLSNVTAEKSFALAVTLSDQAEKLTGGPFRYALATVPADGNFKSTRMLPLVITKKQ